MFPFSPVCVSTTLSTNLMFYGYTIYSCSSQRTSLELWEGHPVTGQDSPLQLQEVQGKYLLEDA